jgi:aspartate--ammonia ligase
MTLNNELHFKLDEEPCAQQCFYYTNIIRKCTKNKIDEISKNPIKYELILDHETDDIKEEYKSISNSNFWKNYLNSWELQAKLINTRRDVQRALERELNLFEVIAPLILKSDNHYNDYLDGSTNPVEFNTTKGKCEIVQSLAKWKRLKLNKLIRDGMKYDPKNTLNVNTHNICENEIPPNFYVVNQYGFYKGLITNMHAIRPCEDIDATHSFYVEQWDWEAPIKIKDRSIKTLFKYVEHIWEVLNKFKYPKLNNVPQIKFIHSSELFKDSNMSIKEKEDAICKKYGAVCIVGIGGGKHGNRSPEYDDYSTPLSNKDYKYLCKLNSEKKDSLGEEYYPITDRKTHVGLNCDILVYHPVLKEALELSSMGIRVNANSFLQQLIESGQRLDTANKYHRQLINEHLNAFSSLPQTIGGGIGIERYLMWAYNIPTIMDVQESVFK